MSFNRHHAPMQGFAESPREVSLAHLRFFRWLAERDDLEHPAVGAPCGLYALAAVVLGSDDAQAGLPAPSGRPHPT